MAGRLARLRTCNASAPGRPLRTDGAYLFEMEIAASTAS